uniref:Uncharacterized protein n=1 Tax=Arundo donax TaxID=35708 RepID=A0A0A9D0R8_ARUDO
MNLIQNEAALTHLFQATTSFALSWSHETTLSALYVFPSSMLTSSGGIGSWQNVQEWRGHLPSSVNKDGWEGAATEAC